MVWEERKCSKEEEKEEKARKYQQVWSQEGQFSESIQISWDLQENKLEVSYNYPWITGLSNWVWFDRHFGSQWFLSMRILTRCGTTDWFSIGNRIQQGCILSPCLFSLHAEYHMWNAGLDESQVEIKTVKRNIKLQICRWRRHWHPTPLLLPGESHGRRSLVGYSPWGR